jgi:PKD repeat protein
VIFLIGFLILSSLLVFPVKSSYTSHVYPAEDSWVEAEFPNGNHGSETSLRVKSDSRTRRSYLKYDLNSVPSGKSVTSVKLYLYCTYKSWNPSIEIYVHETGDSWDEASITWNNAPAVDSFITSILVNGTGQYYCWDITSYGQTQYFGDKILSIVVKLLLDDPTQNNPNLARYFTSKEYDGTAKDPYLEVIYDDSAPVALFTHSPSYPVANDTVTFNASASYDPDGCITTYSWDFDDGNVTAVSSPMVTHSYLDYGNYTVTLTVMDNDGLTDIYSEIVEVVDPAILRVSLPEGAKVGKNPDPWLNEGWLLNQTGNSWSFTLKIEVTSCWLKSYDTHLIVALNDAAYTNLLSLTINGTSIPKTDFQYGKPKPYGTKYWSDCVYPTWFDDTYVNVGKITRCDCKILTVSATFSDDTDARMHFDTYGSIFPWQPCGWCGVTWSPHSEDSSVVYQAAPTPLSVSISPTSKVIDLGQYVTFTSSVSGGTSPYNYQWYLDGAAVTGAHSSSWIFTPTSTGYYLVHLNVTDNLGEEAKSNISEVTVNPELSVSIQPASSVITLGQSVDFTSSVSGGTQPYNYQWYVNDTEVSGANSSSWTFTPTSTGYYLVSLKVTDDAPAAALSNEAEVTVVLPTYNLTIIATTGGTTNPVPGTYSHDEGTNVQVIAIPDVSYQFIYWELDGTYDDTGNPTTVLMNENHTLKAIFAVITYTLTITTTTGGTTSPVPGAYTYDAGSSVPVQALPSANYLFAHWELDGSHVGTDNPTTAQMDDDHTLHAVFSLINYTLTITTTAGGTTDPAPSAYVYASGSSAVVTATPDINYKFIHWEIDGSNITDNPVTVLMDKNYTLHAVFQLLTYRLWILSSTDGTTDPVSGTHIYVNGTLASVTAIPHIHYLFDYWELDGNNASSANTINVLMTDDHTLQPFFKLRNYTLTITATAGGTTDPTPGTYVYPAGTIVEVTAIPDAGYRFDYWSMDGSPVGSVNPMSLTMDHDVTLEVVFAETHTLIITVSEGGTTDPSPGTYTYDAATNVVVEAIPSSGYLFDYWEFDGEDIGSENPITVYVGSSHALKAFFTPITYQLTITTSSGGTTDPVPGTYSHGCGSSVGVEAVPDACYVFDHWMLDGSNVGSVNPYSVLMDDDHALNAVFTYSPPSLSVSINPSSASIVLGDSVSFTSIKSGGTSPYTYQWYLDDASVSGATSSSWTFTPLSTGTYDVYLKVTDACNTIVQSGTTKVTVGSPSPAPVGGYSVSLTRPVAKTPLICYTMILAILGLATVLIRRKRK